MTASRGAVLAVSVIAYLVLGSLDYAQHYRLEVQPLLLGLAQTVVVLLAVRFPWTAVALYCAGAFTAAAIAIPVSSSEPWPWAFTTLVGLGWVYAVLGYRVDVVIGRMSVLPLAWLLAQIPGAAAIALWPDRGGVGDLVPAALVTAAAIGVGHVLRTRAELRHTVAVQQEQTQLEQERRAGLEERARIARELHDVVAHHLSIVVVRADSASARIPGLGDAAKAELDAIATEARASLDEMRRVLRLLRHEGPQDRLPAPTLGDVHHLIASARESGAHITATIDAPTRMDATLSLTAYRVVQESLSNALRHAPGSSIDLSVRSTGSALDIRLRNGGTFDGAAAGHGITGMRERVDALGGTLVAGPTQDGFDVHAQIPLSHP